MTDEATQTPQSSSRRAFFRWFTLALGGVASVLAGIPIVGYLFATRKYKPTWVTLGPLEDFPAGQTRMVRFPSPLRQPWDGETANTSVFVRNELSSNTNQPNIRVFAENCAHLGCAVSWFPESGLFMCPCHGGVYYSDGERASGPPPRGLYQCEWRVRDGKLEIIAPHFPSLHDPLQETA